MATSEISVILSTYERPRHLERSLASLAQQEGVDTQFEVVVTDDGSRDETPDLVRTFAKTSEFPVRFATHEHRGFQLAACRNNGVRASTAPYLLFSDGDCVFPPNHLQRHLAARRRGVVRAGDCVLLDRDTSASISPARIAGEDFLDSVPPQLFRRPRRLHRRALWYQMIRHGAKPTLVGNNIGVWRSQLERINGFDQQFRGWGCEDDDLAARLRRAGFAIRSVLGYTHAYHLWHPPHSTTPAKWSEGTNVAYLRRPVALTRCLSGLEERSLSDLRVAIAADQRRRRLADKLQSLFRGPGSEPELVLLLGVAARPTVAADCTIAVIGSEDRLRGSLAQKCNAIVRCANNQWSVHHILQRLDRVIRDGESTSVSSTQRVA
ncbi:glycosyltransferase [Pirellulales bacterium]|nr:glycosyltransferase [Pirellulales bacterium]